MKDEYSSQECAVCSAPADGLHYGAISCRSCNAFFRRTVVEKSEYRCKHNNNCVIDPDGRCACRSCRFTKCVDAGMKVSAVQPRRDPTGSQKERKKRSSNQSFSPALVEDSKEGIAQPEQKVQLPSSGSILIDAIRTDFGFVTPQIPSSSEWYADKMMKRVKMEMEEDPPSASSSEKITRFNTPNDDDHQEYQFLVYAYGEHQRMMQLSFSTFEQFLLELESGRQVIPMEPTDVNKLSAVELTGLLYWIEKQKPYRDLPAEDRSMLLKRYSVRKLSLDHFYTASKHPEKCQSGEFVMNNYTYVPADKTGFELPEDDVDQITLKRRTFASTFFRFWSNVIEPFTQMKVTDAEIVFLQIMLLWSSTHNEHVSRPVQVIMKQRRDWVMCRLFDWYHVNNVDDPEVRFGQLTMILGEIEIICDLHCQDFHVAKLFDFCDMSRFWYESLCYAPCNTRPTQIDCHALESITTLNAIQVINRHGRRPDPPPMNDSRDDPRNDYTSWQRTMIYERDEQTTTRESDSTPSSSSTSCTNSNNSMHGYGRPLHHYSEEEAYVCPTNDLKNDEAIKMKMTHLQRPTSEQEMIMHNVSMGIHLTNGYNNGYHHNGMMYSHTPEKHMI